MTWAAMLMLQVAAPLIGPAVVDRLKPTPAISCNARGEDIVVCGKRTESPYRLTALPPGDFEPKPLRAGTDFGGGASGDVSAERKDFPGGIVSNRIMLNFKKKF